jgi:hypothetical protein
VLDATKLIPEEDVPLTIVGRMVLDRNVDNFFAETEQVAFLPTNVVPGIDFSNDPLLQGRLFSYLDTQKSRLGTTNFHQIPINAPKCPFANMQRDGMMQTMVPKGRANYEPNSLSDSGEAGGPRETVAGFASLSVTGERNDAGSKLRVRSETFKDHFSQARLFFRSQAEIEQAHMASAMVFELSKVGVPAIRERVIGNLLNVDVGLATRVAEGLGMALPAANPAAAPTIDMKPSDRLSIVKAGPPPLKGRKVAILFADGSDGARVEKLAKQVRKAGGKAFTVAPRVGGVTMADGTVMTASAVRRGRAGAVGGGCCQAGQGQCRGRFRDGRLCPCEDDRRRRECAGAARQGRGRAGRWRGVAQGVRRGGACTALGARAQGARSCIEISSFRTDTQRTINRSGLSPPLCRFLPLAIRCAPERMTWMRRGDRIRPSTPPTAPCSTRCRSRRG